MWLLKGSGAGKKQLQEHEPLQPEGTLLESPGTMGTNNGRDRQRDRQGRRMERQINGQVEGQSDSPPHTHTVRPTDRQTLDGKNKDFLLCQFTHSHSHTESVYVTTKI